MTAPTALLEPPEVAPPNTVLFRGLTVEEIAAYEQRLEALTLEAMRRVMRQVTRNLGRTTTAALVAAVDPSGISPDDLAGIIPLWQTQLDEQLLPVVAEIYRDSSGALSAQMLETVGNPPPVSSAAAEAYLARARAQFAEVGGELWEQARNQLLDGMSAGESVPQIADRLRTTTPALTNRTASLIARTQVNDAANAGSFDTARVSGLDLLKGWESTADLRTRETHLMAGSTYSGPGMIGLDDPFMVGGWPCLRPHDLSLPPEERYNCRCTLIYRMRTGELTASEQVIRDLEAEHAARLAALQAQHNQQLDQLLAQHAQRVAVMEQQHAARTAAIEARYQAKLAQIQQSADTATVVAQSIAKAKAAHQLRLAQWEADYQLRTAKRVAEYEQRVLLRNTYFDQRRAVLDAEYQHRLAVAKGQTPGPLASKPVPTEPATGLPPVKYRLDTKALEGVTDPETVARITEALDWYRGIGFSAINRSLRGAIPESAKVTRTVQAIDDAMAASPLPSDAVVYRGIRGGASFFRRDISQWDADLTGFEWQDLGLASTAPTSRRVTGYALGDKDDATILRITVPKGTQALQISTDPVADTAEIVLTHGLRFRVVADHGKDAAGFRRLDVEVVPSGLASTPLPTGPAVTVPVTGQPTLVPVRASLLRATTVPEVRKAFIQEWQRIVKANPGAIRGAARFAPGGDVQTAREHAEGLLRAIERFPHTRLDVTYGSMPHYAETAARRVSFATEYAHARDDYLLSLRLSGAMGPDGTAYHPITISSPQGIALHEFGHALQYGLAFDQQGVYDYGLYLQVNRRVRKLVQDLADERGVSADDLIRMEIGGYAQEGGTGELVAEAFADVMVNGDQASALSQRIFTLLVDDYDRLNPPGPGVPSLGGPALPSQPLPLADGLDLLELHSLRSLATEFEIPNAATLTKTKALRELRARGVLSPEVRRTQALRSAIAETVDLIDKGKDLPAILKLLRVSYPNTEVLRKAERAVDLQALRRSLVALAKRQGITLPDASELRVIRAARVKAAREAALAARAEKARLAEIKRQVKAVEGGDFTSLTPTAVEGDYTAPDGARWVVQQFTSESDAREQLLAVLLRELGVGAQQPVTPIVGRGVPGGRGWQVAYRDPTVAPARLDLGEWVPDSLADWGRYTAAKLRAAVKKAGLGPDVAERLLAQRVAAIEAQRAAVKGLPSRLAPPLSDFQALQDAGRDRFASYVDGVYGGARLRAKVTDYYVHVDPRSGGFSFEGEIYKGKKKVGRFRREGGMDRNGKLVARHDYLSIDPNVRGSGFAEQFNRNLIDWYKRSGVDRVELSANIDVGGYAWARAGYEFADSAATGVIQDRLTQIISALLGRTTVNQARLSLWRWENDRAVGPKTFRALTNLDQDEIQAQIRAAQALLQRARQHPGFDDPLHPSAYEFSQLGRHVGQGKDDPWIGKAAMLGAYWHAVLYL
jgi:hypothetical protein